MRWGSRGGRRREDRVVLNGYDMGSREGVIGEEFLVDVVGSRNDCKETTSGLFLDVFGKREEKTA